MGVSHAEAEHFVPARSLCAPAVLHPSFPCKFTLHPHPSFPLTICPPLPQHTTLPCSHFSLQVFSFPPLLLLLCGNLWAHIPFMCRRTRGFRRCETFMLWFRWWVCPLVVFCICKVQPSVFCAEELCHFLYIFLFFLFLKCEV